MSNETPAPKRMAAIGSPSSTAEVVVDILGDAGDSKLLGSMMYFETQQDEKPTRVIGQVTEVEMRNRWHEQEAMRNIIKQQGSLSFLSGRNDFKTAAFSVGACFTTREDGTWSPETLGNVPAAGTPLYRVTQQVIDDVVADQRDHVTFLGRAYGDDTVSLPMTLKHFGSPGAGGQGEAYHSIIVGKTGSGKSTIAKMMLAAYGRCSDMGILVIDPKGEFAEEFSGYKIGNSGLPLAQVFAGMGRRSVRYGITQIRLETWDLFENVLVSLGFNKALGVKGGDNAMELAASIKDEAQALGFRLDELREDGTLDTILERFLDEDAFVIERIYKTKEPQDALRKAISVVLNDPGHRCRKIWDFLTFLFDGRGGGRPTIASIINSVMKPGADGGREIVAIDLSVPGNRRDLDALRADLGDDAPDDEDDTDADMLSEPLQKKIIYRIVSDMRRLAEREVSRRVREGNHDNVNTLVVFEEAHRFAPAHVPSDDEDGRKLKGKLIEAVRETRKFGLGWLFVDQTIGGIDKQIIQQVRVGLFGYGLSMGDELDRLREIIGGDQRDMSLYRSFRDPVGYGRADERKYPWMVFGPVSPMTSNRPLFMNALDGDVFVKKNGYTLGDVSAPAKPLPRQKKPKNTGHYRKLAAAPKAAPKNRPTNLDAVDLDFFTSD